MGAMASQIISLTSVHSTVVQGDGPRIGSGDARAAADDGAGGSNDDGEIPAN